ncbi:MAG: exodeoxyribonuclease VII small subunit [Lachnospiraceae bacterium]|nr:exodeoxyribonuclease VII small subunit [Lachnospiraceae bacterium]MBR4573524.1 exodeoxyribonuclease VII small subunit [Lachnospiraceae bacterium]
MTLEETFEKVDEVMEKLSDDSLPLEESFTVYKEGMELLDKCRVIIEDIEKKIDRSESEGETEE